MSTYADEQIEKLTHALSDEMDAAMILAGIAEPGDIRPFDVLNSTEQMVIRATAEAIYRRLHFDAGVGIIVVMEKRNLA